MSDNHDLHIKEHMQMIRKYYFGSYYEKGQLKIRHKLVNYKEKSITIKEIIILKYT